MKQLKEEFDDMSVKDLKKMFEIMKIMKEVYENKNSDSKLLEYAQHEAQDLAPANQSNDIFSISPSKEQSNEELEKHGLNGLEDIFN